MQHPFLDEMFSSFPGLHKAGYEDDIKILGVGAHDSWFDVTGLASASIGAAGVMLARLAECSDPDLVKVDRRLASLWFGMTLKPIGWQVPPPWDPIAGDYLARDGWVRLHTNAPHHKKAALSVLGANADRSRLRRIVESWDRVALETAIVEAGGCAAAMFDFGAWNTHPQGQAVAREPLIHWHETEWVDQGAVKPDKARPLAGVKILDLTRVLAGPVAGRFLAAYGADILRIDPANWHEPGVVPEVTLGKRCAELDLKSAGDRAIFDDLLRRSDILLHGYRADALEALGYDADRLRRLCPRLIDVSLNAYGWTGPWVNRRGFDSLVQMSSGIAEFGMQKSLADRPQPLPVQALDHATGYLMAAAAMHAVRERAGQGKVLSAKLSLARVAHLLSSSKRGNVGEDLSAETNADLDPRIENTQWGPARRIRFPLTVPGMKHAWDRPAADLRSSPAQW